MRLPMDRPRLARWEGVTWAADKPGARQDAHKGLAYAATKEAQLKVRETEDHGAGLEARSPLV